VKVYANEPSGLFELPGLPGNTGLALWHNLFFSDLLSSWVQSIETVLITHAEETDII